MQDLHASDTLLDALPASQILQLSAPEALYEPALHLRQNEERISPLPLYRPLGQSVQVFEPTCDIFPVSHTVQFVSLSCASRGGLQVPAGQFVQLPEALALNFPAGQSLQDSLPYPE